MRRTGKKKYIQKASGIGISWQEMCEVATGSGMCEVADQAEDLFSWVVGG